MGSLHVAVRRKIGAEYCPGLTALLRRAVTDWKRGHVGGLRLPEPVAGVSPDAIVRGVLA